MEHLEIYQTTPAFENVAAGRPYSSPTELQELTLNALNQGVAIFNFLKTDGQTVKQAIGTLNPALIPSKILKFGEENLIQTINYLPKIGKLLAELRKPSKERDLKPIIALRSDKGITDLVTAAEDFITGINNAKERKKSPDTQIYFDIPAQMFKSYKVDNLLSLIVIPQNNG